MRPGESPHGLFAGRVSFSTRCPLNQPFSPADRSGSMSALIGAIQPLGQQPCRFVRRPSVERHKRAPGSGVPCDVGPPAVGRNRRDLDDIGASRDGFFEAMNDVGQLESTRHFSSVERIILAW
jgi:hypothetical protein